MRRILLAAALLGCGEGVDDPALLVECPNESDPTQRCEAICLDPNREPILDAECIGANTTGVEDEGAIINEFDCSFVVDYSGTLGCCFAGDGSVARFFECEGQ